MTPAWWTRPASRMPPREQYKPILPAPGEHDSGEQHQGSGTAHPIRKTDRSVNRGPEELSPNRLPTSHGCAPFLLQTGRYSASCSGLFEWRCPAMPVSRLDSDRSGHFRGTYPSLELAYGVKQEDSMSTMCSPFVLHQRISHTALNTMQRLFEE